jgi:hypothetical protein
VDFDIYPAEHPFHGGMNYGMWPSQFWTQQEDSSTGYWMSRAPLPDSFVVFHPNSIMMPGPRTNEPLIDPGGERWTARDMAANWGFSHEFQHATCGNGLGARAPFEEGFSAAAEAIAGNRDREAMYEYPYAWSLFQHSPPNVVNYQARRSFTEYLVHNFRGQDSSATAQGMQDDLMRRWAQGGRDLFALDSLLTNGGCPDCSRCFGPDTSGGVRLLNLLHAWRTADYVDNPYPAQGQYGFPAHADFRPSIDLRAWQSFAYSACDDSVAMPPELLASRRWQWQDTTCVGLRPGVDAGSPISVSIPLFGAQYWIVRSDTSIAHGPQDLVVRVSAEDAWNYEDASLGNHKGARLCASAVPYAEQSLPSGQSDSLWKHPSWARIPIGPKWADVDSAAGSLDLVVPDFGTTHKAARVVITKGDASDKGITRDYYNASVDNHTRQRYRLSLGIRAAEDDTVMMRGLSLRPGTADDRPAWSPAGVELAHEATIPEQSTYQQICRRLVNGGTPSRLAPQSMNQSAPDWSPRGDWVAFEAESTSGFVGIWLGDPATGQAHRIVPSSREHHLPAFQPNGQRRVYVASPVVQNNQLYDGWQVRRIDIDGSNDVGLTPVMSADPIQSLRWSPDGQTVFFTRNDSLFSVGGSGSTPASRADVAKRAGSLDLHPGDWRIALEEPGAYRAKRVIDGSAIYPEILTFRRLALRNTATHDNEARFYRTSAECFNPRWSPDGISVACSATLNAPGDRDLYVGRVSFNHPPRFSPEPTDQSVVAGSACSTALVASDPDGQPVTFQALYLPPGATFSGATLSWPDPGPVGASYFVVYRALDGTGGVHSKVVRYDVVESPGGGCPFADTRTAAGWVSENSLLARSRTGALALDAYRLKAAPRIEGGRVAVRLRENAQEYTRLDQVRLAVVDHDPALRAFASGEGVWLGVRVPAVRAVTQTGEDVTARVDGSGADFFVGRPGDTLTVEFDASPVPEGRVRDWFLLSLGTYSSDPASLRPFETEGAAPARFALHPNRPNPFGAQTVIRFELPVESPVTLEVFDLAGRRVATLARGTWAAGDHAVTWDRHRDDGGRAAPGVYRYRLTAGAFRHQRKLVLLP